MRSSLNLKTDRQEQGRDDRIPELDRHPKSVGCAISDRGWQLPVGQAISFEGENEGSARLTVG